MSRSIRFSSIVGLSLLASAAGGCAVETAGEEPVAADAAELFARTSSLWPADPGNNRVTLKVCYDNIAVNQTELGWVSSAIRDSWDANSWVDFRFGIACKGGEQIHIVVEDIVDAPHTEALGTGYGRVHLNFTFINWEGIGKKLQDPSDGTCANAADRENCIRTIAVHEFGHVLGFDHEQNRPDFSTCADGSVPSRQRALADMPLFTVDTPSIMSYCPEGEWNGLLSTADIDQVQRTYGGEGVSVTSGEYFAIRLPGNELSNGNYFFMEGPFIAGTPASPNWSPRIQESGGQRNLARIRRQSGTGGVRYGDSVSLLDNRSGRYYCVTVRPATGIVSITGERGECFWTVEHSVGTVGGTTLNVNDPVRFHWPTEVQGQSIYLGTPGTAPELRVLGSFPRTP